MTTLQRYTPDMVFGGYGDCPAPTMEPDDAGDYVEYQPWMDRMQWRTIESAPCDDTLALAYSAIEGRYYVVDFDHDSDPAYWRDHGLTHWMPLPEAPR